MWLDIMSTSLNRAPNACQRRSSQAMRWISLECGCLKVWEPMSSCGLSSFSHSNIFELHLLISAILFLETKPNQQRALRILVSIGSLWCGHVVTEANSLLSPQMVNSWPQFPGPISMKTPILEGEGCLTETPLIREEDTLKVLQAAFPSQCVCV